LFLLSYSGMATRPWQGRKEGKKAGEGSVTYLPAQDRILPVNLVMKLILPGRREGGV